MCPHLRWWFEQFPTIPAQYISYEQEFLPVLITSANEWLVQVVSCLQGRKVTQCDIQDKDIHETLSDCPSLTGDCHQGASLCFATVFPYDSNPDLSQKSLGTPKTGLFFQLCRVVDNKDWRLLFVSIPATTLLLIKNVL